MKFNPVEMSSAAVTSTRPLPLTAKFGSVVKKKKSPGMSGIPTQFYGASFKSRRSISRSSKLVMKEESQPSGKLRESAKSAFRRDTEKIVGLTAQYSNFWFVTQEKKKGKRKKKTVKKIVWGELSADNANGNTRQQ